MYIIHVYLLKEIKMKEFYRKKVGLNILTFLCLTLSCGGGKGGDNLAFLFLLLGNQPSSSGSNGLVTSEISGNSQDTNIQAMANPQITSGESDLVILNPKLKAWIHIQDSSQCMTYFTITVKNKGNGVFNANSRMAASLITKANVKPSITVGQAFKNLLPGETQDLEFITLYPIRDIQDPNGQLRINAEFTGITDGSKTDHQLAFDSSSDCGVSRPNDPPPSGLPDLVVTLNGITEIKSGDDVSQKLKVQITNVGSTIANGSRPNREGYMVDLILSKDTVVPEGYAPYYSDYKEDVLLGGGRISNTPDLLAGTQVYVSEGSNVIPKNVPPGNYYLCARVDVGSKVAESNEKNNTSCIPVTVPSNELKPDLIIPRASIYPSGMKCKAGKPMMYVTAEIKNIGQAPSPEKLNVGLINALDTNGERWGKGNGIWGNGIGFASIQPGDTISVTFPIYYLTVDPIYMEGTHTFDLRVNRGNWIQESDIKNNGYKKILEITIPEGYCKTNSD